MTKNVKTILMVGGVAIVGYWLWKKYGNKMAMPTSKGSGTSNFVASDSFMNASGLTGKRRSGDDTPNCPACSSKGECYTIVPRTEATINAGIAGQRAIQGCTPSGTTSTTSTITTASRRGF